MSESAIPEQRRTRSPLKAMLAWLLEVDKPIPDRTPDELTAFVERNYTWNFMVNLLDGAFFWFGAAFISSATILSLFLSKLTTNPLAFGLLAVISQAGWYIPQLLTANITEQLPRKKAVVVNLGFITERLPVMLLVPTAWVAGASPLAGAGLLLVTYTWYSVGAGLLAVSWQDLIARTFPVNRRGRLLGLTQFFGAGMGTLGALVCTWLLERYAFPTNFVYTFALAAVFIFISWIWLALTREPVQRVTAPRQNNREYLAKLPELVRRDRNFQHFLVARSMLALGGMGVGFVTVSAVSRWQIPDATAGLYTFAWLVGQTIGNVALGFLSDRRGHKLNLEIGALTGLAAFALAWLAPSASWFYVVFALNGIVSGALFVSGILIVMELADQERRPTYAGIANTMVGVVSVAGPLIGAALAKANYDLLFAASAVAYLVGFGLFKWWVREPRTPVPATASPPAAPP